MSSNRRYQLENLWVDLSERYRFNLKRIRTEIDGDEEELAFYANRALRLERLLDKLQTKVGITVEID